MEAIRDYILTIISAAILCAILTSIVGKSAAAPIWKLVCGIFLCFCAARPLTQNSLEPLATFPDALLEQAQSAAAMGEELYKEARLESIKQESEAYILDKAQSLQLDLFVRIHLTDSGLPDYVTLTGSVNPQAKTKLQKILEHDLGIPKERQLWIE